MNALILLAILILASACAPSSGNAPLPELRIDASADLVPAVDWAIAWWQERGAPVWRAMCKRDDADCATVVWAWDGMLEPRTLGETFDRAIFINPEIPRRAYPPHTLDIVVAHEIGHALGLMHVKPADELMNATAHMRGRVCIDGEVCRDI